MLRKASCRGCAMTKKQEIILVEEIEPCILLIRGQKIMLDTDLAKLYGVTTKRLNEQVKRNRNRFPGAFSSNSPPKKKQRWSQIATTSPGSNSRPCCLTRLPNT